MLAVEKIRKIEAKIYRPNAEMDYLLVRLESTNGLIGFGEATCPGHNEEVKEAIEQVVAPQMVGRDLSCFNYVETFVFPKADLSNRIMRRAAAGVEIAAWDALGKLWGEPVYRLLGGSARLDLPEIAREDPAAGVQLRAVIPAERCSDVDIGEIKRQAELAGKPVVVDFMGNIPVSKAKTLLSALEEVDPWYVVGLLPEEERNAWDEISGVARVPLAARISTRFEACPFVESAPMSIIEADILDAGGIGAVKLLASYLETFYVQIAENCDGGAIAAAAAAHVLYSCPNSLGVGSPTDRFEALLNEPFTMLPGEAPGLGIDLNWDAI